MEMVPLYWLAGWLVRLAIVIIVVVPEALLACKSVETTTTTTQRASVIRIRFTKPQWPAKDR